VVAVASKGYTVLLRRRPPVPVPSAPHTAEEVPSS